MTETKRHFDHYVWSMLSRRPVPRPCLLPCVCPFGFQFEISNDFTALRLIRHAAISVEQIAAYSLEVHKMRSELPKHFQFTPDFWERTQMPGIRVHEFEGSPIDLIKSGECSVCGRQEFGILTNDERLELIGFDLYRRLVDAYSQHAMRNFVDSDWTVMRRANAGRNHLNKTSSVSER